MPMDMPPTLDELERMYKRPAYVQSATPDAKSLAAALGGQQNEAQNARSQALLDAGLGIGVKAGLAWQLANINAAIKRHERDFDTIYDFGYLMIRDRVVPPVITEARDLYNQDGDYALRLSGAYYQIENQARFSSVAPNWRDYLTFPPPALDRATGLTTLLPANDNERRLWRLALEDGWKQGIEQANLMLQHGLDRMNRDFLGMLRFHTFVLQGKITMPAIASETIPVTRSGPTLAIDETLLRITTLPEFNGNMARWKATITSSRRARPNDLTPRAAIPPPAEPHRTATPLTGEFQRREESPLADKGGDR